MSHCIADIVWLVRTSRTLQLRQLSRNFNNSKLDSSHLKNISRSTCICNHFHSSIRIDGKKNSIKHTTKKLVKPVRFAAKVQKGDWPIAVVWNGMTISELAAVLNTSPEHVFASIPKQILLDIEDINENIGDFGIIRAIAERCNYRVQLQNNTEEEDKDAYKRPPPDPSVLVKRPPIVTIMGHVDHGKTTLLDALRSSNVVAQEFGGITQHIGAFLVKLPSGEQITFIDTPGHAAFSAMRARGARVTDIVVLVVAADDGVMQQTIESIKHATDANVPIIVAVNKIDKPNQNIDYLFKSLLKHGVQVEELGGDVQAVRISALKGTNLLELQEAIIALSEVLELKADPTGLAEGMVIESKTDPGKGKVATAIVSRGQIKKGSVLVAGTSWAKVRALFNEKGQQLASVGPGVAAETIGWKELPSAGDEILEVVDERRAKEVVEWRSKQHDKVKIEKDLEVIQNKSAEHRKEYEERRKLKLEKGMRFVKRFMGERKKEAISGDFNGPRLSVVIKGDVNGSIEAILNILSTYNSQLCHLDILHYGVGPVTENDVEMAATFEGIVYLFNTTCPNTMQQLANNQSVQIKHHNIIYKLFDDIKEEMTSRLPTKQVEEVVGEAVVQQLFIITQGTQKVPVVGCRCTKGMLHRKKLFKVLREDNILYSGSIESLRHMKSNVETIKTDVECGLLIAANKDLGFVPEPGDRVICYEMKIIEQKIDWELPF